MHRHHVLASPARAPCRTPHCPFCTALLDSQGALPLMWAHILLGYLRTMRVRVPSPRAHC